MNAGERAIVKEERRLEKERRRRIELANKMLIPTGGKTQESIGLISFSPVDLFISRFSKLFIIRFQHLLSYFPGKLAHIRINFFL